MRKIKDSLQKNTPPYLKFLIKTYLLGVVCFSIFRIVLAVTQFKQFENVPLDIILGAFFMGWRFDTAISGYLLLIIYIIASLLHFIPIRAKVLKNITVIYLSIVYIGAFAMCATDIPYFKVFGARLGYAVLNWVSTPKIMFSMMFSTWTFYPFIAMFIALSIIFIKLLKKFSNQWESDGSEYFTIHKWRLKALAFALFSAAFLMLGIRGRISEKAPIKWGTAFFSPYIFPNQLGLNPVFTFVKSYEYSKRFKRGDNQFMSDTLALEKSRISIDYNGIDSYDSPIARFVEPKRSIGANPNVVLVVMESMSYDYLGCAGNYAPSITPFLDSLISQSIFFDKFYSCGNHTFSGLWGTQLSLPTIPEEGNPLDNLDNMQSFSGLASTLRSKGYKTLFACPHDAQFDNIGGIMSAAGYEKITSQADYFDPGQMTTWGVADQFLFERSMPNINEMYKSGKPFLATFLTVSNHGPYQFPDVLPPGFKFKTSAPTSQGVEYADACIKDFMEKCKSEPWYDNTIFVFVADHGLTVLPCPYQLSLSYMHIPLIIYSPKYLKAQKLSNRGMQIDIFPTVMDLLNMPYVNNTFGVNLFDKSRPYTFHNEESDLCVLSDSLYFLIRKDGEKLMYNYKAMSKENIIFKHQSDAEKMQDYAYSIIQSTINIIKNKKAGQEGWKKK